MKEITQLFAFFILDTMKSLANLTTRRLIFRQVRFGMYFADTSKGLDQNASLNFITMSAIDSFDNQFMASHKCKYISSELEFRLKRVDSLCFNS